MVARVLKDHMALSTPVEKDRNGLMPVSSTPLKLWRSAVHKEPCGRRTDLSQAGVAFYLAYKQGKNAAYILQRRVEHTPGKHGPALNVLAKLKTRAVREVQGEHVSYKNSYATQQNTNKQ